MFKRIAIINKSTCVNNNDVNRISMACNTQLKRDVAPAWGKGVMPVTFYQNEASVPTDAARLYLFDNADQQGALGYHSETLSGLVFGKVFAKTILNYGLPLLYNSNRKSDITVSSVVSHEVLEIFCNPYVSLWVDGTPISEGSEYAYEICDAVEADVYQIPTSIPNQPLVNVSVSNFLYPEYFDTVTPSGIKLDYMGLLKRPFTMTVNGYMIVRSAPGAETAIYGSKYPEILKELKIKS